MRTLNCEKVKGILLVDSWCPSENFDWAPVASYKKIGLQESSSRATFSPFFLIFKMLTTISALCRTATTTSISARLLRRTLSTSGTSGLYNKTEFRTPDPKKPRLVLAYSGGLDTSCQLSWLAQEKGFEVCAYIADLGQDDVKNPADVEAICAKAKQSGAYAFYNEDLQKEFVEDYIHPVVRENFFFYFFSLFFFLAFQLISIVSVLFFFLVAFFCFLLLLLGSCQCNL